MKDVPRPRVVRMDRCTQAPLQPQSCSQTGDLQEAQLPCSVFLAGETERQKLAIYNQLQNLLPHHPPSCSQTTCLLVYLATLSLLRRKELLALTLVTKLKLQALVSQRLVYLGIPRSESILLQADSTAPLLLPAQQQPTLLPGSCSTSPCLSTTRLNFAPHFQPSGVS